MAGFAAYLCALAQEVCHDRPFEGETSFGYAAPVAQSGNRGHPAANVERSLPSLRDGLSSTTFNRWCRSARPPANGCDPCRGRTRSLMGHGRIGIGATLSLRLCGYRACPMCLADRSTSTISSYRGGYTIFTIPQFSMTTIFVVGSNPMHLPRIVTSRCAVGQKYVSTLL